MGLPAIATWILKALPWVATGITALKGKRKCQKTQSSITNT